MYHTEKNYKFSLAAAILSAILNAALFVLAIVGDLYEIYIITSFSLAVADFLLISGIMKASKVKIFFGIVIESGNCVALVFLGLISGKVWIGIGILQIKLIILATLFLHFDGIKKQSVEYEMMREFNQAIEVP